MALSTTQYGYIIDPMVPFTDDKGKTIKNGFVRVFVAGSSTPVITYRNFDGATNQDLIELDNSGRTKTSVIGSKGLTYKVCVYDKHHSQESPILTVDNVSVIGANITAGAGSTVVTGLDGLTTKPNGFVDASVVGTDGYVALDHTLVDDDLDTNAKVDAVENDRYVPLLNEDVNDPDSKVTLGRLWQWVLGKIKNLSTTITAFRTGDVIPVDGPSGTAKMIKDDLLKATAENALESGIAPSFSPSLAYVAGDVVEYNGHLYEFKTTHSGAWNVYHADEIKLGNIAFKKGVLISSTSQFSDVNDLPIGTCYVVAAGLENRPVVGRAGICFTFGSAINDYAFQIYKLISSDGVTSRYQTFTRHKNNGAWGEWDCLAVQDDVDVIQEDVDAITRTILPNLGKISTKLSTQASVNLNTSFSADDVVYLVACQRNGRDSFNLLGNAVVGGVAKYPYIQLKNGYGYSKLEYGQAGTLSLFGSLNPDGREIDIYVIVTDNYQKSLYASFLEMMEDARIYPSMSAFQRFLAIGDSYTAGQIYNMDGSVIGTIDNKYSWANIIARKNGLLIDNLGFPGITSRGFVSTKFELLDALNKPEVVSIFLGINDEYFLGDAYLGTIEDCDTEDYMSSADTYYGNMYKIIRRVQENFVGTAVFLIKPSSFAKGTGWSDAIENLASLAGIEYIESYDLENYSEYQTKPGGHPSISGQALMATYYESQILRKIPVASSVNNAASLARYDGDVRLFEVGSNLVQDNEYRFSSLIDALWKCSKLDGKKRLTIYQGTYDVLSELGGMPYILSKNRTDDDWKYVQPVIHDIEIIGKGRVILTFNITYGTSVENYWLFSCLNFDGNARVENIEIQCKNCRYGIHDESSNGAPNTKREYVNVRITKTTDGGQAYGAGYGADTRVYFKDCYFSESWTHAWSCHASNGCSIVFDNCEFELNRSTTSKPVRISQNGNASLYAKLSNCYIGQGGLTIRSESGDATENKTKIDLLNTSIAALDNQYTTSSEQVVSYNSLAGTKTILLDITE